MAISQIKDVLWVSDCTFSKTDTENGGTNHRWAVIALLVCKLRRGKKEVFFQTWPADVRDGMLSKQLDFLLSRHMLTVPTAAAHTNQLFIFHCLMWSVSGSSCSHGFTTCPLFSKELAGCIQIITYWHHQGICLIQYWETLTLFQSPRLIKWSVLTWNQTPPLCQHVIS